MGALISYRNHADSAVLSLTGGAVAGYPVANLQTRQLSHVARMTAAASPQIVVDLGIARFVSVVGLFNINASALTSGSCAIEYSVDGLTWTPAVVAIPGDSGVPDLPRCLLLIIPPDGFGDPQFVRYLRIRPLWARIGAAAYYEIGRLWVGDALVIKEGCDKGFDIGFVDSGALDFSAGNQAYEDKRERVRVLRVRFGTLTTLQAYGMDDLAGGAVDVASFQDLQMAVGLTGEVIVIPRSDTALWIRRAGIYGHIAGPWSIKHLAGGRHSAEFSVQEER